MIVFAHFLQLFRETFLHEGILGQNTAQCSTIEQNKAVHNSRVRNNVVQNYAAQKNAIQNCAGQGSTMTCRTIHLTTNQLYSKNSSTVRYLNTSASTMDSQVPSGFNLNNIYDQDSALHSGGRKCEGVNWWKVVKIAEKMKRGSNAALRQLSEVKQSKILFKNSTISSALHDLFATIRNSIRIFSYDCIHQPLPTEV
jgi:hypothetical protein